MRGWAEAAAALAAALVLHAAALWQIGATTGAGGAGDGGAGQVTLAAIPPGLAETLAGWDAPPAVGGDAPAAPAAAEGPGPAGGRPAPPPVAAPPPAAPPAPGALPAPAVAGDP
ncbi:MAG: hypothetical protein ACK4TB_17705, partial [Gemmobacter sp.]